MHCKERVICGFLLFFFRCRASHRVLNVNYEIILMDCLHAMVRCCCCCVNQYNLIDLGCRQHFCPNHIVDHINELRNRFEEIVNEYNLVKEIFDVYKQKFSDSHWKLTGELEKELNEIKNEINQCQKTSK